MVVALPATIAVAVVTTGVVGAAGGAGGLGPGGGAVDVDPGDEVLDPHAASPPAASSARTAIDRIFMRSTWRGGIVSFARCTGRGYIRVSRRRCDPWVVEGQSDEKYTFLTSVYAVMACIPSSRPRPLFL